MVDLLEPSPSDTVIEIGPGRGALTKYLVGRCAKPILIEKDKRLAEYLRGRFGGQQGVEVIEGDATRLNLRDFLEGGQKALVISNLPYEASTAILSNLLRQRALILRMVLMFQREVAERIAAKPGDKAHGSLSSIVQVKCRVEPLFDVAPSKFFPAPKVWSRVLLLSPYGEEHPFCDAAEDPSFEVFVRAVHTHPRKKVLNSLSAGLGLERQEAMSLLVLAGVEPNLRPSDIPLDALVRMWRYFRRFSEK